MSKRERMKDPILVRKQESIANEMASLHERIMRRAYEIFEDRGGIAGIRSPGRRGGARSRNSRSPRADGVVWSNNS